MEKTPPPIDKAALLHAMVAQLEAQLETLLRSAEAAHASATHADARAENQYDTRGLEAGYLAQAQAGRAEKLRAELAELRLLKPRRWRPDEPAAVGALLALADDRDAEGLYFLSPGRGLVVQLGKRAIQVLAAGSPLGRELHGKGAGDEVELEVRGEARGYEIRRVW